MFNKYKKIILKTLLLSNSKKNKIFSYKNKYKNQQIKLSIFPKTKKILLKSKK